MEEQEIINKVIYNYTVLKYGIIKSGKEFNLTSNKVKKILKDNNIYIRNHQEAMALNNKQRGYKKNEDFFSIESHDMAWILGFIASDGTIRKDGNGIKLTLSAKDREILEKIRKKIEIENPIKDYCTNNGFDICEFVWFCEKHKQDLAKYSIIPNKTFKLQPPWLLDRKYWIDYIRGYFDGDGSINLIKDTKRPNCYNLRWQICGAQKEFLQWIIDFLYEEYDIPKVNIYTQKRKANLYYFQYSTNATKKIYTILYNESDMYLKRKKDLFDEIMSIMAPLNKIPRDSI